MGKNGKNRQWYLDAGLVVIIIILIVMIALALRAPAEDRTSNQQAGDTLRGYSDSTPQTLVMEETEEAEAEPAPDFELQALTGEMVSLSDFNGKPVLINFWATWCPPCVQEMPLLQEISDDYAGELVVLPVNGGDSMEQIRAFAEAYEYNLRFLADPENALSLEYSVRGFPTSFFIDVDGLVQGTYVGMMDENIISYYLEKIGVVE
jgi:thiol-disulfide isomerase/thioredoxin